jgi:para-nitrobenzyl esterase
MIIIKRNLLLFLTPISLFVITSFWQNRDVTVFDKIKVDGGYVSGTVNSTGDVHFFKGIPFAAPPVGKLRWRAPQPVLPWNGVKVCDKFGPSPMQANPVPFSMWSQEFLIPKEPISEDCLYLNLWTPAISSKEKRAVLVWIYGGGFSSGGSAVPIYDGEAMAKKGIMFVSINYRVGIFGFFANPQLTKESGHQASGNYGLLDQIAALKWIQKNIAAFGGDPANVTIAGQSAGSMSVNCLVASELAKNLFQKAIGESGASFTGGNINLENAEQQGEKIMLSLGDTSIAEMRAIPAEELMKKAQGHFAPVIDGYVLQDAINKIFMDGKENKVPLLTGWNEEEGLTTGPLKSAADYRRQIEKEYGADSQEFLQFYPAINDLEANQSQLRLSRDIIFGVQNYTWANIESSQGLNVYVYRFIRRPPATGEYKRYGAFHTAEVPYAYDNLQFVNRPWESVDYKLADIMSSYWVNFAKSGNPNGESLPEWSAYKTGDKKIMLLGKTQESEIIPGKDALDFLYKMMTKK